MTEFNSTDPAVIRDARPASATIQITLEDGTTDTVTLNAKWVAMLIKRLRHNGPHHISISGMIPAGSKEITPENASWACSPPSVEWHDTHSWQEWLQGKPSA